MRKSWPTKLQLPVDLTLLRLLNSQLPFLSSSSLMSWEATYWTRISFFWLHWNVWFKETTLWRSRTWSRAHTSQSSTCTMKTWSHRFKLAYRSLLRMLCTDLPKWALLPYQPIWTKMGLVSVTSAVNLTVNWVRCKRTMRCFYSGKTTRQLRSRRLSRRCKWLLTKP